MLMRIRMRMRIATETEFGPEVVELLSLHLQEMAAGSPPESMHALAINELRHPDIVVWSVWNSGNSENGGNDGSNDGESRNLPEPDHRSNVGETGTHTSAQADPGVNAFSPACLESKAQQRLNAISGKSAASRLMGIGAMKKLSTSHAELKSMRTAKDFLKRGVATALLDHIVSEALQRGYTRLSLETGSMPSFQPALSLYQRYGFVECEPFAQYVADPNSVFMSKVLVPA